MLTWDDTELPAGRRLFLLPLTGAMPAGPPLDMADARERTVESRTVFAVLYGTPAEQTIALDPGWNLVGAARGGVEPCAELLPTTVPAGLRVGPVWYWTPSPGGYTRLPETDPLFAKRGCWVRASAAGASAPIAGLPLDGVVDLARGWNLMSPAETTPYRDAPAALGANAWAWDAAGSVYQAVTPGTMLEPGRGYWIYVLVDEYHLDSAARSRK